MCEQCNGFDDEDMFDAMAAAFVARRQKEAAKATPAPHALVDRKGVVAPAAPSKDQSNA